MRKKKIVLLTWEMLETGGIIRVINGLQTGFEKLGHEVTTYLCSRNGRLHVEQDKHVLMTKWYRPKAVNLGWQNQEQLKDYIRNVREADFVFSVHGCPHPTKSGAGDDTTWQRLYEIAEKLNTPVGIMFTDNLWDKLYPWIESVITDEVRLFFINLNAETDSMAKLNYESSYVNYPMDFNEALNSKERSVDVVWLPQWKIWKGIWQVIRALAEKPDRFNTALFNSGIEYYKIRKEDIWKKAIRSDLFTGDFYNSKSRVNYFGIREPDKVNLIYSQAKVALDLSGAYAKKFQAQVTCSMVEGMMHHTVMAVAPDVNEDKRSLLYKKDLTFSVDPNDIVGSLEDIVKNEKLRKKITKEAFEWAKENCEDTVVVSKIIDLMRL